MKQIPLTQGKFALVDDEDFERLNQWKWHLQKSPSTYYAKRNISVKEQRKSKATYMHREIIGVQPQQEIDHINHNGLDNRKLNLRTCCRAENNRNTQCLAPKTSCYKGVSRQNRIAKPWQSTITFNRKQMWLGGYATEKEAAQCYDRKAVELFGEFANTNF